MKTRRSFTPEFKREAVSLVLDQGYKVSDVCGQFDLGENCSGQLFPDISLGFSSARAGGSPPLY